MCGIIGIFNYQESNFIILELLEGLRKLQNRGRDSYGILLSNSENKIIIKEKELITIEKIKEMNLYDLKFNKVLGHSRYSTSYNTMESKNDCNNSHPFHGLNKNLGTFHLVHNGNINFNSSIKELYPKLNDTKILVKIIEKEVDTYIYPYFYKIIIYFYKLIPKKIYNMLITKIFSKPIS